MANIERIKYLGNDCCLLLLVLFFTVNIRKNLLIFQEFFWERHLRVKVNMAPDNTNMLDTILLEPWEGISQEEFSMMIDKYLTEKLGPADHSAVLKRILKFGDFNNNGVVRRQFYVFIHTHKHIKKDEDNYRYSYSISNAYSWLLTLPSWFSMHNMQIMCRNLFQQIVS